MKTEATTINAGHRFLPDLTSLSPETVMKETFPKYCLGLNVKEALEMMVALQHVCLSLLCSHIYILTHSQKCSYWMIRLSQ